RAGADWFDMKGEARFGNEKITLERVARALDERERFIRLSDGSLGVIPREWISKLAGVLGLLRREREEGGEDGEPPGLRASLAQLAIVESLLAVADRSTLDARFKRARKKLESFRGIQNVPLPGRLQGELRDYQKAGYDWLHFLREFSFGGCLADEMGLGKTVQVLSLLLAEKERREREEKRGENREGPAAPSLVVVPTTLVFNWLAEVEKFAPDLGVYTHHGPGRERDAAAILGKGSDIVITTYGTLRADSDVFGGIDFNYVVLDESQQIKNPLSQVAACARGLKARHRLALTGTPVENNTLDLWSQFAFLNPGLLGGLDYFKRAFAAGIDRDGDADRAAALKNMIKPFILLRRKETVARELPDKQVTTLYCEMSSDQRKVYEGLKEAFRQEIAACIEAKGYGRARMKVLEGLTRLRQVCDHPVLVDGTYEGGSGKLDVLAGRIEEAVGTGHKVLVFSAFVKMLGVLGELFNERGIAHVRLDGSTPAGRRKEVVEAFQRDASVRAFLLSLKAGGFGLNLTAADYVFVVDPWWNPAAEAQAMDRAHRIGQVRSVFVYKAIARDSIEEKVLQLQREKADLFSSIITADDGVFKKLGPEDIRGLFS
ncbi:MAG: DEAD/DEAH box helicase, partial [Pseudomonadota bacterium]